MVVMLGTMNLHNGMILSTLNRSSHDFAFGFPKKPHGNGDIFLWYDIVHFEYKLSWFCFWFSHEAT